MASASRSGREDDRFRGLCRCRRRPLWDDDGVPDDGTTDGAAADDTTTATPAHPGPIAIGVTGHRRYDDPEQVAASVASVLDRLLADGAPPTVVTSLAEGADRLVAEMVLDRGGTVDVILPLPADDYEQDFAAPESRAQFADLLGRATTISVVEVDTADSGRERAYELAGRAMVERSDVLIALWDGAPPRGRGGTAEIIQYALDHGVPVEIVLVDRPAPSPSAVPP